MKSAGRNAQQLFRANWKNLYMSNLQTKAQEKASDLTEDFTAGVFHNFWRIAQEEGGLMNRECGIQCATQICRTNEARGPPFVMYDPSTW